MSATRETEFFPVLRKERGLGTVGRGPGADSLRQGLAAVDGGRSEPLRPVPGCRCPPALSCPRLSRARCAWGLGGVAMVGPGQKFSDTELSVCALVCVRVGVGVCPCWSSRAPWGHRHVSSTESSLFPQNCQFRPHQAQSLGRCHS